MGGGGIRKVFNVSNLTAQLYEFEDAIKYVQCKYFLDKRGIEEKQVIPISMSVWKLAYVASPLINDYEIHCTHFPIKEYYMYVYKYMNFCNK